MSYVIKDENRHNGYLNNQLRTTFSPQYGKVIMTEGVKALSDDVIGGALAEMSNFDAFTPDNDPRGEHSFGIFGFAGRRFIFKIDLELDPFDQADLEKMTRVLTLMLVSEW